MNAKSLLLSAVAGLVLSASAFSAGTLTAVNAPEQPIEIRSHEIDVVINNGFARTRVTQTFYNPNPQDLEAIYAFPVPEGASLAEMRFASGESTLEGEVVSREDADRIYQTEKEAGNETGKADRESFQRFEFRVHPVRGLAEARLEFVYYQPIQLEANIGRFLYPLAEGGTDEAATAFWTNNSTVTGTFAARVEIRSEYPVTDVRVPGFQGSFQQLDSNRYEWSWHTDQGGTLDEDLLLYYRLADNLPGRIDLLTYREPGADEGTFMLILTPGVDLKPLSNGADYVFVLDKSGSMAAKLSTLADGIEKALGKLAPHDRFRIVLFDDGSREMTNGWIPATAENVTTFASRLRAVASGGGTNLYAGIDRGVGALDQDRATNFILVTDGVLNVGIVDPQEFDQLLRQQDLRFFGFLMGNSANWPIMRTLCEATDGAYTAVSTRDDIVGKILAARDRITTEALLDVDLRIRGVRTSEVTRNAWRKLYRGQQLVLIGKFTGTGPATIELDARTSEGLQTYTTTVDFPAEADRYPELERIWATARIDEIERQRDLGMTPESEAADAIRDLGIAYQVVTDETSMLLLNDASFERHGIDRRNRDRMQIEHAAQHARATQPVQPTRADTHQPMFNLPSPTIGGGAFEGPVSILLSLLAWRLYQKRRQS